MDSKSLAHSGTPQGTRERRGIEHGREHLEDIYRIGRWAWRVPSCSDPETIYIVTLKPEYCPCPDFSYWGEACKHLYAATYVKAKTATCDGCARRFRRRDLTELTEDNHDNLTYFDGDRLCADCADLAGVIR